MVQPTPNKTRITIRVDTNILNWFREQVHRAGGNYQTFINEALREHIRQQDFTLERTLQRVIREELQTQTLKEPAKRKSGVAHRVMA